MKISVSKILEFYYPMSTNIDPCVLEKAGQRGSYIHQYIENYFDSNRSIDDMSFEQKDIEKIIIKINNFNAEIKNHKLEVKDQEVKVNTEKLRGIIDFVGIYDNKPVIIDWKTNSSLGSQDKVKYMLQLNLYRYLYKECYGQKIDDLYIVHITNNKKKNLLKFIKCELMDDTQIQEMIDEVFRYYNEEFHSFQEFEDTSDIEFIQ